MQVSLTGLVAVDDGCVHCKTADGKVLGKHIFEREGARILLDLVIHLEIRVNRNVGERKSEREKVSVGAERQMASWRVRQIVRGKVTG